MIPREGQAGRHRGPQGSDHGIEDHVHIGLGGQGHREGELGICHQEEVESKRPSHL